MSTLKIPPMLIDSTEIDLLSCSAVKQGNTVWLNLIDVLRVINSTPIVDPVHAAGGCYCSECEFYFENQLCFNATVDRNGDMIMRKSDDFCSVGKRKEV